MRAATTADKIVHFGKGQLRIGKLVPEARAKHVMLLKILSCVRVTPTGCWQWTAYCNPTWGYGEVSYRGKCWRVHRLLWTFTRGAIPDGKILCHSCDNPPCCNPDHLWIGTDKENHVDKTAKGRHHYDESVKTHCKHGHEFTPQNTRYTKVEGRPDLKRRACLECHRLRSRERYWKRTPEQKARINQMRNAKRAQVRAELQQDKKAQA